MNIKVLLLSIKRNTWLVVLLAILTSFLFPKAGISLKPYLDYLLMFMMFLSCLDIELKEILTSFGDYKNQILVLAIVHLASPLLIYLFKDYMSAEIFLGLILASTIPAGRSAVFLCNIYGGDPTKALVVTSISNAISPLIVPLVVWVLARTSIDMNPMEMSAKIIYLVVIPILAALIIRRFKVGSVLAKYGSSISVLTLFLIILGIISPIINVVTDNLIQTVVLGFVIIGLTTLDFTLGFILGKKRKEKITYAISSSYKNYTLSTLLALSLFSPLVALPSIVYTITNNMLLVPLQLLNKARQA